MNTAREAVWTGGSTAWHAAAPSATENEEGTQRWEDGGQSAFSGLIVCFFCCYLCLVLRFLLFFNQYSYSYFYSLFLLFVFKFFLVGDGTRVRDTEGLGNEWGWSA